MTDSSAAATEIRLPVRTDLPPAASVICPVTSPAFASIGQLQLLCGACGAVLMQNAFEQQVLDIFICCPNCRAFCETPCRKPGQPLVRDRIAIVPKDPSGVPPGTRYLESTDHLPIQLVATRSVEQYLIETGDAYARLARSGATALPQTAEGFARHAAELIALLGDEYPKLRASYDRGTNSPTPPSEVHQLVRLIAYAEELADVFGAATHHDTVTINPELMTELLLAHDVFARWQSHPTYLEIVKSLVSPLNFQHELMTLTIAGALADQGNGVRLIGSAREKGRIPDLQLRPSLREKLDLEVKTPLEFRAPVKGSVTQASAEARIQRLFDAAASTSRGQMSSESSGILAIGAFHLGYGGAALLRRAAQAVLNRQTDRKPHIVGISIFEATHIGLMGPRGIRVQPVVHVEELAMHPNYQRGLQVVTAEGGETDIHEKLEQEGYREATPQEVERLQRGPHSYE